MGCLAYDDIRSRYADTLNVHFINTPFEEKWVTELGQFLTRMNGRKIALENGICYDPWTIIARVNSKNAFLSLPLMPDIGICFSPYRIWPTYHCSVMQLKNMIICPICLENPSCCFPKRCRNQEINIFFIFMCKGENIHGLYPCSVLLFHILNITKCEHIHRFLSLDQRPVLSLLTSLSRNMFFAY